MNKHTPRPWRTIESTNKTMRTVVGPDFPGQGYIADVNGEANARLIAAAPELLEALKQFVDYYESMQGHKDNSVIRNGKAAINKAEGREG